MRKTRMAHDYVLPPPGRAGQIVPRSPHATCPMTRPVRTSSSTGKCCLLRPEAIAGNAGRLAAASGRLSGCSQGTTGWRVATPTAGGVITLANPSSGQEPGGWMADLTLGNRPRLKQGAHSRRLGAAVTRRPVFWNRARSGNLALPGPARGAANGAPASTRAGTRPARVRRRNRARREALWVRWASLRDRVRWAGRRCSRRRARRSRGS